MRVLLTVPDLDLASGGLAAVAQQLAGALAAAGESVTLLYSVHPGSPRLPVPKGVFAVEVPREGSALTLWRRCRQTLAAAIVATRPAVLHDHGLWRPENAAAMGTARDLGLPLVVQPCGMLQQWPMAQRALKKRLAWHGYQKRLLAPAAAVVVTSAEEQRETARWLPRQPPMVCIPHGVAAPAGAKPVVRQRQAVFVGRLHPKKQIDVLLRSWSRLKPQGWQLCIAGTGEPVYERALRQLADEGGAGEHIRFLGQVQGEAKSRLLAESQLFLQPSLQENFGLAVAEALAHGLPVLTTHEMPWAEVETLGCGWSVAASPEAIHAALAEALALPAEQLAAMGERAAPLAARYNWTETARQTIALYERLRAHPA